MRVALLILSLISTPLTSGCAAGGVQPVSVATDRPGAAQTSAEVADVTSELLGLTQEWVRTWNEKDVDRMQELHSDDFLYGIFGSFGDGRALLNALRRENFWGVTYTLKMEKPLVRILSSDTALVLFQLVGKSVSSKGERPYASLFTLVYQKRGDDWKIIHVHDSESPKGSS